MVPTETLLIFCDMTLPYWVIPKVLEEPRNSSVTTGHIEGEGKSSVYTFNISEYCGKIERKITHDDENAGIAPSLTSLLFNLGLEHSEKAHS